jgi:hypothetical protein
VPIAADLPITHERLVTPMQMNPIVKRVISEFWIAVVIALAWAIFRTWSSGKANWLSGIVTFLTNFGGALFLVNWFTGQFFRVTRQHETEQFLKTIVDSQKELTSSISVLTKRIEEALRSKEPTLTVDIVRDVARANSQVAKANSAVIEVLSNLPWEPTGNFPFQATSRTEK